jgi:hypothetical protein
MSEEGLVLVFGHHIELHLAIDDTVGIVLGHVPREVPIQTLVFPRSVRS